MKIITVDAVSGQTVERDMTDAEMAEFSQNQLSEDGPNGTDTSS